MGTVRVAVTADLHITKTSQGTLHPMLSAVADSADALLIAGDLTDHGLPEEAQVLARELTAIRTPVVAVLGNHDVESSKEGEVNQILKDAGVKMLDGDACEVLGVGVAGVKGFGGGFGPRALAPWGEAVIKLFAREAVEEALKLEKALTRLRTERLIALLHYSPVRDTVEGEPLEIYPFLGSSRLEEPLSRFPVSLVVHGHAHRGQPEGRTSGGIPVYNVSMHMLARSFPDRQPFRVLELSVRDQPPVSAAPNPAPVTRFTDPQPATAGRTSSS
jgi:Icc-related predicted phosphoesterase